MNLLYMMKEFFILQGFLLLFFNYPSRKFQEIYKKPHRSPMQLPGCCCRVVVSSLTPCSNYCDWPVLCAGQGYLPHHQAGNFANMLLDTGNAVLPRTTTEKIQGKQNSDHIHRPTHQDIIPTIAAETAMLKLGPSRCLGLKPANRAKARSGGNPQGITSLYPYIPAYMHCIVSLFCSL